MRSRSNNRGQLLSSCWTLEALNQKLGHVFFSEFKMSPEKFEKVVLMLSSDQPGEVFAAAQAIGRALPDSGLDWHQFARLVAGRLTARPGKPQEDTNNTQYRADEERYREEHTNRNNISAVEISQVNVLMNKVFMALNEREQEFISSVMDRIQTYGARTFMSPKQRAWLAQIWEKSQ